MSSDINPYIHQPNYNFSVDPTAYDRIIKGDFGGIVIKKQTSAVKTSWSILPAEKKHDRGVQPLTTDDIQALFVEAANQPEKMTYPAGSVSPHVLQDLPEFQRLAKRVKIQPGNGYDQVTPLRTKDILQSDAHVKFQRAVKLAGMIGKGVEYAKTKGKLINDQYWREVISGGRIYGGDAQEQAYFTQWSQDPRALENYFTWRLRHHPEASTSQAVAQCNDQQRKDYLVEIKQGKAQRSDAAGAAKPYDTYHESTNVSGQGTAIFVLSTADQLYCNSHKVGQFHHSSFLAGGAVKGAGEIRTNSQGEITWLSNKSGHYKPRLKETLEVLNAFHKQGVDLTKVRLTFINDKGVEFTYNNAKLFLDSAGKCLPSFYKSLSLDLDPTASPPVVEIKEKMKCSTATRLQLLQELSDAGVDLSNAQVFVPSKWGSALYNAKEYLQQKGSATLLRLEKVKLARDATQQVTHVTDYTIHGQKELLDFLKDNGIDASAAQYQPAEEGLRQEMKDMMHQLMAAFSNGDATALEAQLTARRKALQDSFSALDPTSDLHKKLAAFDERLQALQSWNSFKKPAADKLVSMPKFAMKDLKAAAAGGKLPKLINEVQTTEAEFNLNLQILRESLKKFLTPAPDRKALFTKKDHLRQNHLHKLSEAERAINVMPKECRQKLRQSLFIDNEIYLKVSKPFYAFLKGLDGLNPSLQAVSIAQYLLDADLTPLLRAQESHNLLMEAYEKNKVFVGKTLGLLTERYSAGSNNIDPAAFFLMKEGAVFQRPTRLNMILKEMAKQVSPQDKPIIDAAIAKLSTINRYMEL